MTSREAWHESSQSEAVQALKMQLRDALKYKREVPLPNGLFKKACIHSAAHTLTPGTPQAFALKESMDLLQQKHRSREAMLMADLGDFVHQ